MTQDEIIELARRALEQEPREDWNSYAWVFADETLRAFAKLVAEKEREACAKLLETTDLGGLKDNPAIQSWVAEMLLAYVKAIRARSN
jgi:hypothetical protein